MPLNPPFRTIFIHTSYIGGKFYARSPLRKCLFLLQTFPITFRVIIRIYIFLNYLREILSYFLLYYNNFLAILFFTLFRIYMKVNLPQYMIQVDNKLIRGKAVTSPLRLYKMKQAGINQIIDLRNTSFVKRPIEKFFCKLFGIKYQNFKYSHLLESLPEPQFFYNVNNAIRKNEGKTYIHCQKGKRRTGICVALYEKYFTQNSLNKIISNMINIGFTDVFTTPNTKQSKKYYRIIKEFLNTYIFKN